MSDIERCRTSALGDEKPMLFCDKVGLFEISAAKYFGSSLFNLPASSFVPIWCLVRVPRRDRQASPSRKRRMKNAVNTELVLRRCKFMNCVLEGQSFSLGIMDSELGGRQTVEMAMATMSAAGLISEGRNGTYVLTGSGSKAISDMVDSAKPVRVWRGNALGRRSGA